MCQLGCNLYNKMPYKSAAWIGVTKETKAILKQVKDYNDEFWDDMLLRYAKRELAKIRLAEEEKEKLNSSADNPTTLITADNDSSVL